MVNKKTASQKEAVFLISIKKKLILRNKGLGVQKQFQNHYQEYRC